MTSHGAGLAVPDWPTSYGRWFPPMVGNVFWEHGHRMIAGTVGILTLLLAISIQLSEKRRGLKVLAWISFGTVVAQALLGGLTVLTLQPAWVSVTHACLAQTFFCLTVVIAYLCRGGSRTAPTPDPRLRRLLVMTAGFIYLQLIFGAVIRHTGWGIPIHVLLAFLVLVHVLLSVLRIVRSHPEQKKISGLAVGLGAMTVIQIFLGMGAFIFTKMIPRSYAPSLGQIIFTTAHQSLGALILASAVLLILMVTL